VAEEKISNLGKGVWVGDHWGEKSPKGQKQETTGKKKKREKAGRRVINGTPKGEGKTWREKKKHTNFKKGLKMGYKKSISVKDPEKGEGNLDRGGKSDQLVTKKGGERGKKEKGNKEGVDSTH